MKKRILSLVLIVAMMVAMLAINMVTVSAYSTGDTYPAKYKAYSLDTNVADEWNFYPRQCTSFVAWCLNSRNGVRFTNQYLGASRWGHAKTWGTVAASKGVTVNRTPAVGSVAWWNTGTYGHVAWVRSVNGNYVTIEEYNWKTPGGYGERTLAISDITGGFIHIKDLEASIAVEPIHQNTNATIRNGFFTVKNVASGTYLNVWGGTDSNGTPITTYSYDDSTDQQFNFVHQGNGKYKIYPYCSSNGTNRVVDILRNNAPIAEGQKVDIYDPNDDTAQLFYIVPLNDDTYVFEIASKDGYVIAPPSEYAGSNDKNSQLTVQRYTGANHQKWKFCNNNGGETHPIGSYSVDSYKVNTNGVNLTMRSGAGSGYAKVASIPDNTNLNITQVNGNWGYTSFNGYSGWVCLDFCIFAPSVTKITAENMMRTYTVGDTLDITSIQVTAEYSNGSTKIISTGFTTSYDFSTAGTKTVTVTYEGKTTSFTVNVIEPEVIDVQIATNAEKTSYYVGDALNTTNLSLLATYNNGDTKIVTSGFTTNYDFSSAGTKTVTVTYSGLSVSYDVTVQVKGNGNVVVSSSKQKLYYDNEFSVNFDLKNAENIYDGNFNVVYDNNVLEVVKTSVGASLKNSSSQINPEFAVNKVRFTFAGTAPLVNGNLLTVTFKVKSDKVSNTTISIEGLNLYTSSGDTANSTSSNLDIEIGSYDYTLTDIYFLNSSDQGIDKVPSNGNFYVGVEFNKNISGTSRPNVIFALYDDYDKIIDVKTVQNRYSQGDGLTCETDFSVNSKYNVSKVKVFVWDSAISLKPLSNVIDN